MDLRCYHGTVGSFRTHKIKQKCKCVAFVLVYIVLFFLIMGVLGTSGIVKSISPLSFLSR